MKHPNMQKVYKAYAGFYDRVFRNWLFPRQRYAIRQMDIRPGEKVLEVGVGTGMALPEYPRHCRVTGVDISDDMLDKAREKVERHALQHVDLHRMDAMELDFPVARFDHVVMAFVVSVVPDPVRVLHEAKRVAKRDANFLIVNHFRSRNRLLAALEDICSPLFYRIGWRTDLCLHNLVKEAGLQGNRVQKMRCGDPYTIVFASNS
jgi:phosphatidylethanolamine/phosphatidyl-N-methylethanolamine N-methyltransferase